MTRVAVRAGSMQASRRAEGSAPVPTGASPRLSVIVPVYRDWDSFTILARAFGEQAAAVPGAELIAVNNDAAPAPEGLGSTRMVDCLEPGAYAARNAGARAARGDWLVFTDADCRPEPGWLEAFAAAAARRRADIVAGPVEMVGGVPPNRWEVYDMFRGIPQRRYVSHGYAATANVMIAADLFRRLGGFDPARRSGGDAEFCRRARAAGAGLAFAKSARVRHPARASRAATMTKARRVKGGQIAAGSTGRRAYWLARTVVPPLHELARYLVADRPWSERLTACAVRGEVWGIELAETLRLLAGGEPERR